MRSFVAVPTKVHYPIIKDLLEQNMHVFAEKAILFDRCAGRRIG